MKKRDVAVAISVVSCLIGMYRTAMNYPMESILVPWFCIPIAAVLVFWFHGDGPELYPYTLLDSITETTLIEIRDFCNGYYASNETANAVAKYLSSQTKIFQNLASDIDEVFCMRFSSAAPKSYISNVNMIKVEFLEDAKAIVNKLRTIRSYTKFPETDIIYVKNLINNNDKSLEALKKLVDISAEYRL